MQVNHMKINHDINLLTLGREYIYKLQFGLFYHIVHISCQFASIVFSVLIDWYIGI